MVDHMYCNCQTMTHSTNCPYRTKEDWEADTRRYWRDRDDTLKKQKSK